MIILGKHRPNSPPTRPLPAPTTRNPTGRALRRRLDGDLRRQEPALLVAAVAKRLVLRLPAAAQGDHLFARRDGELVAQVVDDLARRRQEQRAVFPAANRERLGHRRPPQTKKPGTGGSLV